MTPKTSAKIAAWILTGVIVVVTLGPVGLRPQFGHPAAERFIAYALLALTWTKAYPRRRIAIALGMAGVAIALELGQGLVPGRDPGFGDALAKVIGVLFGVWLAGVIQVAARRPSAP